MLFGCNLYFFHSSSDEEDGDHSSNGRNEFIPFIRLYDCVSKIFNLKFCLYLKSPAVITKIEMEFRKLFLTISYFQFPAWHLNMALAVKIIVSL